MKHGLIPIIVIALVLLCACGGGNENPGSAPESGESVQSAQNGEESKTGTQESSAETSAYEQSENGGTENPKPEESEGQQTEPLPLVGGPADRTGRRILISEGCKYTAFGTRHEQYGDDGRRLTDGVLGGEVGWGWQTSNGRFVLDLGSVVEGLADFDMYLRGDAWGIVPPTKADYYVSSDGKKWELAGSVSGEDVVATPADGDWVEYSFPLAPYNTCNARYVRFDLSGAGMNYAWMHEICVWKYVEAEPLKTHEYTGTESLDNTTFKNTGHMGDDDGPAYCVYSNVGYNKAEMSFALSEAETSTLGRSGIRMNGFVFLGINAYNDEGYWCNCCDAGVCYTGENGGWSLFWGTADDGSGKPGWYSGGKTLDPARNYVLTLDSSQKDNFVVLTVTDADDGKVADRAEFRLAGTKADGSNTDYLTDIAVDWAGEESWIDADGNPTEDWREVLFACAGQKMYFKNIRIYGCTLYSGETRFDWDSSCTDRRGLCPDAGTDVFGTVITVHHIKADSEYVIDIDLG